MKLSEDGRRTTKRTVTPFAGVWIEIILKCKDDSLYTVTPFAGVWIEIVASLEQNIGGVGHSLRGSVD